MKILYLVHQFMPETVGGTEVYTHSLATRLVEAGHEVAVLAHREWRPGDGLPAGPAPGPESVEGIPVHPLCFALGSAGHPAAWEHDNPAIEGWVRAKLRELEPDLVHAMHLMKLSSSALEACRLERVPYLVTLTDFWSLCLRHTLLRPDGRTCPGPVALLDCVRCAQATHALCEGPAWPLYSPRFLAELGLRLAASFPGGTEPGFWSDAAALARRPGRIRERILGARRILVLSAFQKSMLVRNGYPADRLEVIPHGLETRHLAGFEWSRSEVPRVVFVGTLVPYKGLHMLLDALAARPRMELTLAVHGGLDRDDPYHRTALAAADRDPRIRLHGSFHPGEFGRVLGGADAVAVPSLWYENEPLIAKAALALGLPLLASRIGSLTGMLRPGEGELVEPDSAEAWGRALERVRALTQPPSPRPGRVATMDEHMPEIVAAYHGALGAPP